MTVARAITCIVVLTGALWTASEAAAQEWIYFNPVEGEVRLSFDGRWKNSDSSGSRDLQTEESVRMRLTGHSLDPRILTFNLELEPVFAQQDSRFPGIDETNDSQFLNYGAGFRLLHGTPRSPISFNADASRNTGELDGNLGSRTEFISENRNAALHWKTRYFPSTISYSERDLEETFISGVGNIPRDRDELLRTVRYHGRSSKMDLLLEGNEFDDRTPLDQDYDSQQGRLSNYFRWGKGSSLTSRAEYFERTGFNAQERYSIDESVHLQHLTNLSTDYGYRFQSSETLGVATDTQSGIFGLNHRLYQNLSTSLGLGATVTESDEFRENSYDGRLDFVYTKKIPWDGKLTANLGGGYRKTDRTAEPGALISVVGETHVWNGNDFTLDQRSIDVSTIIATAPSCGGSACVLGSDYNVAPTAGDLTLISIPTGSRIGIGETITFDYAYDALAAEFEGYPYRAGIRIDFGWISVFHQRDGENQELISGDPGAVNDRRNDVTGFELRWSRGGSRATFGADRRFFRSDDFESTEYTIKQSLYYVFRPNLFANANATQSFSDANDIEGELYTADLSLSWFPIPRVTVRPFVSTYYRTQDPGLEDRFVGGGVDTRWNWRQLEMDLRYSHEYREASNTATNEDRVLMNVKRRF